MDITLLPQPRSIETSDGTCTLTATYQIENAETFATELTINKLKDALSKYATAEAGASFLISIVEDTERNAECYHLHIRNDSITILAGDAAGAFYAVMTLHQLIMQYGNQLPTLVIDDSPDFPNRGVMLDISRDKVPTMKTLYEMIDMFAAMKLNQVQLYTEHTFAYKNHETVWKDASPMTAEEIQELDAYCKEYFIELVPNQNSFGHLTHWLKHDEYKHLAEAPDGWTTPWDDFRPEPFSLAPEEPGSIELIAELYDELLPNFTSDYFNVGCDETWDVGQGKSKELVEEKGSGRVYLDFLLKIYNLVKARGKTMMFWGDIINQHPDLVPEVPKDTIALEWWYEDVNEYMEKSKLFADSGIPFYVCPGTSSWATIAGRTQNCIANIQAAVEAGLEHGAIGVLNTDWGDNGHWQPLPVSYLGFAYGAATSWCYDTNKDIDLPEVLDIFIFKDKKRIMGQLAYDLGNTYLKPELTIFNGNILFWMYHFDLAKMKETPRFAAFAKSGKDLINDWETFGARLKETSDYIMATVSNIEDAEMAREDAELIESEFMTVANMMLLAVDDAQRQINDDNAANIASRVDALEKQMRANWLARNREGGLSDSMARLNMMRERNQ